MFIDGRTLPPGTVIETDIAIIGAGAAGITLARELRDSGREITLIESGSLELEADTQALYEGESGAVEYPLAELGCAISAAPPTTGAAGAARLLPSISGPRDRWRSRPGR